MKKFIFALCTFLMLFALCAHAEKTYELGDFQMQGTTPASLGYRFSGRVLFEYDLYIPANITYSNNAVVFGSDSLAPWASVGAALYINSGWSGVEDVFYTQNATGNGTGSVSGSTLSWKNVAATAAREGYTKYAVEETIDTTVAIAGGNGVYQLYITPEDGERVLITTSTAPGTALSGWHGFRTSFNDINSIGVWTNSGVTISVENLRATASEESVTREITKGISLVDGYGVSRTVTLDGGVEATFDIDSENKDGADAIVALYSDEGVLENVAHALVTLSGNDSIRVFCPAIDASGYDAKVFLLESGTIIPITSALTLRVGEKRESGFVSPIDVTLSEGMFEKSMEKGNEYIKSMSVDRLLAPSFEVASLPTPNGAARYGGWEALGVHGWGGNNFTLAGHSLGHWMSAAAIAYAESGDVQLKEMLDYAVEKLDYLQTAKSTGYIGGVNESCFKNLFSGNVSSWADGYWVPWYGIHKIYQGLLDAYTYTNNTLALKVVTKFTDWAYEGTKGLSDSQLQTMLGVEHGGMNDTFAQIYDITGDERYLTLAVRFTHNNIITPLTNGKDSLSGLHANTQIPKIIGAAEIYDCDNSRTDYRAAAQFFWDSVVNTRSYVIGGNSISEHFEALGAETLGVKTCESCNTYNMLKLTEHLFAWDHDSRYMDFYETALYNHILGQQDPDTGNKMYFVSTLPGHYRIYGTAHDSFWCCTGTGMENPGRYSKCIYYKDAQDLYVNLFIPSTVEWKEKGLTLSMETDFPYSENVKLTVTKGSANANIKIRIPAWVNGEASVRTSSGGTYSGAAGGYLTIGGAWTAGDTIEITLPMALSKYTSRDNENKVAFTYGPVVLAGALGTVGFPKTDTYVSETGLDTTTTAVPQLLYEGSDLTELLTMTDRTALTFTIDGQYTSNSKPITLMPFYNIHHQFHNVYWFMNDESYLAEKKLNDITIDSVVPDGQQDEIGHTLKSQNSNNGSFENGGKTYMWRDAWGSADAYFSYVLAVDGTKENFLYVSYWGSDAPFTKNSISYARDFNIYVDDVLVGTQTTNRPSPDKPYNVFYAIPESVTAAKSAVTVKFAPKNAQCCAGGVLEIRVTDKKLD